MSSCVTRKVVDTSIYSVIPHLVDMSRILFMLWSLIAAASNEIFLFGSSPRTMGCLRRTRTGPPRAFMNYTEIIHSSYLVLSDINSLGQSQSILR